MNKSTSLITITQSQIGGDTVQAVSARDLHAYLESTKDFTNWMKTQVQRGKFSEGKDFEVYALQGENPLGGRPRKEYLISTSMAEHIGMMSGTEKGHEVRNYFQKMRDVAKGVVSQFLVPKTFAEALRMYADEVEHSQALSCKVEAQAEDIQVLEPKAAFCDAVSRSEDTHEVREAAKMLNIGPNNLWLWLVENKFLYKVFNGYLPYECHKNTGLFTVYLNHFTDLHGVDRTRNKIMVTGKGLIAIQKKMQVTTLIRPQHTGESA